MKRMTALWIVALLSLVTAASAAEMTFDAVQYAADGSLIPVPTFYFPWETPTRFVGNARMTIDNSASTVPLTNVAFQVEIHSDRPDARPLGSINGWDWADPRCPWYGLVTGIINRDAAPQGLMAMAASGEETSIEELVESIGLTWYAGNQHKDHTLWGIGLIYRPAEKTYSPLFTGWKLPGHESYAPVPEGCTDPLAWHTASGNRFEIWDQVPAGLSWDLAAWLAPAGPGVLELFSTATGTLTTNERGVEIFTDANPYANHIPEPATLALLACGAVAVLRRRKI